MEAELGLGSGIRGCLLPPIRYCRHRLGRSNPRIGLGGPAGGDSTACGPVKSPHRAPGTGRWGFDSPWAGQIPASGSRHRPVGIRQPVGRSNPRSSRWRDGSGVTCARDPRPSTILRLSLGPFSVSLNPPPPRLQWERTSGGLKTAPRPAHADRGVFRQPDGLLSPFSCSGSR